LSIAGDTISSVVPDDLGDFDKIRVGVNPLKCPKCGGIMKIISFIEKEQSGVIMKILRHCGLWKEAAPRHPPRPVPEDTFEFRAKIIMRLPFLRRRAALEPVKRTEALMGTAVFQEVYGINAAAAAEQAVAEIKRLERLWGPFNDKSELALLARNAGGSPVEVSPDTTRILAFSKAVGILSGGAFAITTGPLIRLWRKWLAAGLPPRSFDIAEVRTLLGSRDIELLPNNTARLMRAGQGLDLGAVGKGYAADRVAEIYKAAGVRSACISLGGNVMVIGRKPSGAPWIIGIRNPSGNRDECAGWFEGEDISAVTSGAYERFTECNGVRYHHILDPATGRPSESDAAGVTVIAKSSMVADALSTAAFVLGIKRGARFIESFKGVQAVFVDKQGKMHVTKGTVKVCAVT
jgi:thiamine biosynthesis lipoprotein